MTEPSNLGRQSRYDLDPAMYVRFQSRIRNPTASSMAGIFGLAYELRDKGTLAEWEQEEIESLLAWFRMHLEIPAVLKSADHHRAICWFHPRALEPIRRARSLKRILEDHGYVIDQITTRDPGVVIYKDGWQVVAKTRRR